MRLRLAAVEPSQRWFGLAGQPTALVAVSRPEARVNVRRVSPTVLREIEATYGKPPSVRQGIGCRFHKRRKRLGMPDWH
ncbi:MAG: hypothetical protein ACXWZR_14790 [Mycobacterium sp.]